MALPGHWRRERCLVALWRRTGLFVYRGAEGGLEEGSLGKFLFHLACEQHLFPSRIVAQQLSGLPANGLGRETSWKSSCRNSPARITAHVRSDGMVIGVSHFSARVWRRQYGHSTPSAFTTASTGSA